MADWAKKGYGFCGVFTFHTQKKKRKEKKIKNKQKRKKKSHDLIKIFLKDRNISWQPSLLLR